MKKSIVGIVGCPLVRGQRLPGVGKGPDAIRKAKLVYEIESCGWQSQDYGNVLFSNNPILDPENLELKKNLADIYRAILLSAKENRFTLALGGNHSISGGTIPAMLEVYPDMSVIWIDAHADANTPDSSPSGNYHGMVAADLMGWFGNGSGCLPENKLVYVGLQDVDPIEAQMLNESNVHIFTMRNIVEQGVMPVMQRALQILAGHPIHVSLDIDSIDPTLAPGTGTPVPGGLTHREIKYICERLAETQQVVSMDLVEINPDQEEDTKLYPNTCQIGVDLVKTIIG